MNLKNVTAIFDVDKTLLPGYSIIDFATYLLEKNLFDKVVYEQLQEKTLYYQKKIISYNQFAKLVVDTYAKGIADQSVTAITQKSNEFWEKRITTLYPYVLNTFQYLDSTSAKKIMLSGSTIESLYPLISGLNFDRCFTSEIDTNNNFFLCTVKINAATLEEKVTIIHSIFSTIESSFTVGFGDSVADLSFLELVDLPIVVGTHDAELNKKAKEQQRYIIENPEQSHEFSLEDLMNKAER